MALFSFSKDKFFLGIDIGDSSLKMVELKKKGKKIFLSNYAFSENVAELNFNKIEDTSYLARAVSKVINEAGIQSRRATVSLPTFSVFSSIINVSVGDKKMLASTISEEAKKVIPLPLDEMILDWKIIPDEKGKIKNAGDLKVFLTGSPKKLVKKYIEIFKKANLSLASLETETFSLVRSLIGNDKSSIMIVEIGANSTDLSIIKESIPVLNRSLSVCSTTITKKLAEVLGMSFSQAEQFKLDLNFSLNEKTDDKNDLPHLVLESIEPIITEMKYLRDFYQSQNPGPIEKIVLSGGGSLLLNLADYLSLQLDAKVIIGDPWNRINYPQEIKPVLLEAGPKLAVAIGLAMRGIE